MCLVCVGSLSSARKYDGPIACWDCREKAYLQLEREGMRDGFMCLKCIRQWYEEKERLEIWNRFKQEKLGSLFTPIELLEIE